MKWRAAVPICVLVATGLTLVIAAAAATWSPMRAGRMDRAFSQVNLATMTVSHDPWISKARALDMLASIPVEYATPGDPPYQLLVVSTERKRGIGLRVTETWIEGANSAYITDHAAGWPLSCVSCRGVRQRIDPNFLPGPIAWSGGLEAQDWMHSASYPVESAFAGTKYPIPTTILWPSLAVNIVFWSLLFLGSLVLVPALRRTLRRRRNLCTTCAYNRSGLAPGAPCPECGALHDSRMAQGQA